MPYVAWMSIFVIFCFICHSQLLRARITICICFLSFVMQSRQRRVEFELNNIWITFILSSVGNMNSPCLSPFFSQNTISFTIFILSSANSFFLAGLSQKPATKLPLGIKQIGLFKLTNGFSETENTKLLSAFAGPLMTSRPC